MLLALLLAALPQVADEAPLRVYLDAHEVPHVFAADERQAYRGLGFAQGLHFPVATLANLWSATGRFAEVAGPSVLARDERFRLWGFDRRASELASDEAALEPAARANLRAYVDGVNAARRWWLAEPERLAALLDGGALGFDPVPAWLNPRLARGGEAALLGRLLAAEVTLEHVLALGLALAAGPEFGGGGQATRTNVMALRDAREDGHTWFLADVHQPIQGFGYRSYVVQLSAPGFELVGHSSPGHPVVLLGANRTLAFGSMTLPKPPRALAAAGVPFRIDEDVPVVRASWRARLAPGTPRRIVRGSEELALVERTTTLRYFDPVAGELRNDPRGPLVLRTVLDPGLGLELPVTTPGPREALADGGELVFEARTFQGQRSLWESWMQLARATHAGPGEGGTEAALAREWLTTGRGQVCLFADAQGDFECLWSARGPRQGEAARTAAAPRDGADPALAWQGFHGPDALWRVRGNGRGGGAGAGWILCNDSPHVLPVEGVAYAGPPELAQDERWTTLRQPRARELFARAQADGRLDPAELEALALDVQDGWARRFAPLLLALRADPSLSVRAREFLDWIEAFQGEGPDGRPGAEPFLAHPRSQVMPFLALVRDRLADALLAHDAREPAALALAFDPLVPLPDAEEYRTERWSAHAAALRAAVEWAAELRAHTLAGEPGGLVNARVLARRLAPELLAREQAAGWPADAPPVALRWGALNALALTPHRFAFEPEPGQGARVEEWLAGMLAPARVRGALPYHARQKPFLAGIGGTHDSLFQTHRDGLVSLTNALFPRGDGLLAFAPVDFGSQALLLVELVPGGSPRVRTLSMLGASELLVAVPGLSATPRPLFRSTEDFLAGRWTTFETDEARLGAAPGVRRFNP